jgi:hypothetical protein
MKTRRFVICIDNAGYPASLELRKIYVALPDPDAERHSQIRIIDESGEDYVYPASSFIGIELPKSVADAVVKAA